MDNQQINNLAIKAQRGNKQAMSELVGATLPKVRTTVRKFVPAQDSEDVVQDVYLRLLRSLSKWKHTAVFTTWFYSLVSKTISEYWRVTTKRCKHETYELPGGFCQDFDSSMILDELLEKLEPPERALLKERMIYPFKEIALKHGITYECARTRYRRAKEHAREVYR